MRLDGATLLAILGMTVATYLCRGGGYWVFQRLRPPPLARAMLAYVPGALFVSYVAPMLVGGGPHRWAGALATVAVMVATRSMSLAIVGGTAAAWAVWALT